MKLNLGDHFRTEEERRYEMFVYVARLTFGRGDAIIIGIAKTEKKAKEICERNWMSVKGVEKDGDWEKEPWGYLTLKRKDGPKYTISEWVLEGEE